MKCPEATSSGVRVACHLEVSTTITLVLLLVRTWNLQTTRSITQYITNGHFSCKYIEIRLPQTLIFLYVAWIEYRTSFKTTVLFDIYRWQWYWRKLMNLVGRYFCYCSHVIITGGSQIHSDPCGIKGWTLTEHYLPFDSTWLNQSPDKICRNISRFS